MKLEAVITCVNYSDFLAASLPHNRGIFDRMVVVTAPEDKETRRVCNFYNVECLLSDVFETRWGKFNKGRGINAGLKLLSRDGWLVHMDADIVLPPMTRPLLDAANLDQACIYGLDRHMVPNSEAWREFLALPKLQQEGWSCYADSGKFIHPHDKFPIGVRVSHPTGYVPIGFFQLWHSVSGILEYPEHHTDAGRGDMLHALRWPRSKRNMIPEVIAYHLESEPAQMGTNWSGRKTKLWI